MATVTSILIYPAAGGINLMDFTRQLIATKAMATVIRICLIRHARGVANFEQITELPSAHCDKK